MTLIVLKENTTFPICHGNNKLWPQLILTVSQQASLIFLLQLSTGFGRTWQLKLVYLLITLQEKYLHYPKNNFKLQTCISLSLLNPWKHKKNPKGFLFSGGLRSAIFIKCKGDSLTLNTALGWRRDDAGEVHKKSKTTKKQLLLCKIRTRHVSSETHVWILR